MPRRRFKQSVSFTERLAKWALQLREQARKLPAGSERDDLLTRARQADTASRILKWAHSPRITAAALELLRPQNLRAEYDIDFQHRAQLVANIDGKMLIGLSFYHDPNNSVGERSDSLLMRGLDVLQQPTFIVYRNDVT
jgi:hypothetical protein